jgi:large subunit ribosomal protein L32
MPPLPKRKTPKAKKNTRRSHLRSSVPHVVPCPRCGSPRMSHRACDTCLTYRGRQVFEEQEAELTS